MEKKYLAINTDYLKEINTKSKKIIALVLVVFLSVNVTLVDEVLAGSKKEVSRVAKTK